MDIENHLLIIDDQKTNLLKAKNSLNVLYEEFREFVYNVTIEKIFFTKHSEEIANTIVSDVFLFIWESPLKWDFNKKTHETQIDGFKAYLSTIARTKLKESLRKSKPTREGEINLIDDEDSEWKWEISEIEYEVLDENLKSNSNIIEEALLEFKEKSRDILRMYFLFYDEEKYMDKENIRIMEDIFQTKWQNIRKLVSRAKDRIETLLQDKIKNNGR